MLKNKTLTAFLAAVALSIAGAAGFALASSNNGCPACSCGDSCACASPGDCHHS